jgi:AcrR family transcriptional regulator
MGRKNQHTDKQIRILEALNLCLQEKPFSQTSIKDIARAAGVNHGLLHYYFDSKEDILINYIDYVIQHYKTMFEQWRTDQTRTGTDQKQLVESFFTFMTDRITLNRQLSKVFIEIWEIGAYDSDVRRKLQAAYAEWIDAVSDILKQILSDDSTVRRMSTAMIAFLEGISLFSVILDPKHFDCRDVLTGFQARILDML